MFTILVSLIKMRNIKRDNRFINEKISLFFSYVYKEKNHRRMVYLDYFYNYNVTYVHLREVIHKKKTTEMFCYGMHLQLLGYLPLRLVIRSVLKRSENFVYRGVSLIYNHMKTVFVYRFLLQSHYQDEQNTLTQFR